jgi:hypothetical protein
MRNVMTCIDFVYQVRTMLKRYPIVGIVFMSVVLQLLIYCHTGIEHQDNVLWYNNAATSLLRGNIDVVNMPCYPLLFALVNIFAPTRCAELVVCLQIGVFYCCVCVFYQILRHLKIASNISVIVTAIFALSPMMLEYNVSIRPESLAASVSILLFGSFVIWLKSKKFASYCSLFACSLFLIFLRPSFVYLLVVLSIISCVFLVRKLYRRSLQMLLIVIIACGALCIYCSMVKAKTGVYTVSTVTINNEIKNAERIGLLKTDSIAIFDAKGTPSDKVYDELTLVKSRNYVYWYFLLLRHNFSFMTNQPYCEYFIDVFNFQMIWLFLLAVGLYMGYDYYKTRKLLVIPAFLWLMCVGNLFINMLGGYSGWNRLFLQSYPLFLVLIAQGCNMFKIKFRPVPLV